jgi:outer membrane protein assembly factor BamB
VPATIHGVRQIVFFTQSGLVSLDAEGRELWRYPFPYQISTAASPVVWQDMVYCSAGYGVGAGAVRVSREGERFSVQELWRHPGRTMSHWSTPVCKDGYLYALIGFKEFGTGPLKCIELATGVEKWSQPGFGSGGATVRAGEHLLVQSDRGPLVLVEARPDAFREVARAQVLGGKCWTMPAISNGRIYARNTKEGVCLDVRAPGL